MVKVYQTSSASLTKISLTVEHGPDGEIYKDLSTVISAVADATTGPTLMVGAVGAADNNEEVIGEWILPRVTIEENAGTPTVPQWAVIEVFEMRKAF
jgi:hypothetical protein